MEGEAKASKLKRISGNLYQLKRQKTASRFKVQGLLRVLGGNPHRPTKYRVHSDKMKKITIINETHTGEHIHTEH